MIGYKNRQRTNDIHIIGVLEERTKNATELVFKIKDMNLLIQKKAQQGAKWHTRTCITRQDLILFGAIRRKHSAHSFSLGREREKWNVCLTFQLFGKLPKGLSSVSLNSEGWLNQHSLDAWGLWRTKKNLESCCNTRKLAVPLTNTRGSKRLQQDPDKETSKPLLTGKLCADAQRRCISRKGLRGFQTPYLSWLVRALPCMKPIHKDWEWWLLFQMHKLQQKLKAHEKNRKKNGSIKRTK